MGEVNIGGGRMEMNTDVVGQNATQLTQGGDGFRSTLAGILGRIAANEKGIGTDDGAAAFRGKYDAAKPSLISSADNVPKTFTEFGTSMTGAVADYERADQEHSAAIARTAAG